MTDTLCYNSVLKTRGLIRNRNANFATLFILSILTLSDRMVRCDNAKCFSLAKELVFHSSYLGMEYGLINRYAKIRGASGGLHS